ncbi:MAG: ribonuclease HI [Bdellovibrionales bacterium RIFCSPHIGHO2_01_FULL_40_29]|nr:MAG: ribonuclease HI [Bdellovibrionales bacterium RIFCSPHIGHO2_01_FULL_40_29]OFZ33988.1 MAG: ribonuclease HI [Bdellovibrionales bacterium RIFCSPHIGHO2_02_FULL_40_15]
MVKSNRSLNSVVIYGDGACSGNPGPGGFGAIVIFPNETVQELAEYHPQTTNNRMEILAIMKSLRLVLNSSDFSSVSQIQIFTDSVYLIRAITQWLFGWKKRGWKTAANEEVANQDLWIEFDKLLYQLKLKNADAKLEWNFVKGHSGDPGNERCDELAVSMSKRESVDLYSGSIRGYHFDVTRLPEKKPLPEFKDRSNEPKKPAWYLSLVNGVLKSHKTWSECEAVVKGRPGVKFKKVTSQEEEEQVKRQWGL